LHFEKFSVKNATPVAKSKINRSKCNTQYLILKTSLVTLTHYHTKWPVSGSEKLRKSREKKMQNIMKKICLLSILFLNYGGLFSQSPPQMENWFLGDKKISFSGSSPAISTETQSTVPGAIYNSSGDAIFKIENNGDIYEISGSTSTYLDALAQDLKDFIAYPADCSGEKYFIVYFNEEFPNPGDLRCAFLDIPNSSVDWDQLIESDVYDYEMSNKLSANDQPRLVYSTAIDFYMLELANSLGTSTSLIPSYFLAEWSKYFEITNNSEEIMFHGTYCYPDNGAIVSENAFYGLKIEGSTNTLFNNYTGPFVFATTNYGPPGPGQYICVPAINDFNYEQVGDFLITVDGVNDVSIHSPYGGSSISSTSSYTDVELAYDGKIYLFGGGDLQEIAIDASGVGSLVGSPISTGYSGDFLPRQIDFLPYQVFIDPSPEIVETTFLSPCASSSNGEISHIIEGLPPFSSSWGPGSISSSSSSNTSTAAGLTAGTYTVTVTGCNSSFDISTNDLTDGFDIEIITTNPICISGALGSAAAETFNESTLGMQYSWTTSATTQSISNLSVGTYSVTVTNSNGCSETSTIELTETSGIGLSLSASDATCQGIDDGTINTSTIWAGIYDYDWSNGPLPPNSPSNYNLSGNSYYTVTIYDIGSGNSCQETASIFVGAGHPFSLATIDLTEEPCYGSGAGEITQYATPVSANYSGYTPSFDFDWSTAFSETGVTQSTIDQLLAGTYTVTVTDVTAGAGLLGCYEIQTHNITNSGSNDWQEQTDPSMAGYTTNVMSMAIDNAENIYVAGTFNGDINIQGVTVSAASSNTEMFIASFNSCGRLLWLDYSESVDLSADYSDIQITEANGRLYIVYDQSTSAGFDLLDMTTSLVQSNIVTNSVKINFIQLKSDDGTYLTEDNFTGLSPAYSTTDLEVRESTPYIAINHNDYAGIYQLSIGTGNDYPLWVDNETGNIINDFEFTNDGDVVAVGMATGDIDLTGTPVGISGTTDAFVAYYDVSASSQEIYLLGAAENAAALAVELTSNEDIAVVGNYTGYVPNPSVISSGVSTGFVLSLEYDASTPTLTPHWIKTLEVNGSYPEAYSGVSSALCADLSINENDEVFLFGTFIGGNMQLTETSTSTIFNANGGSGYTNLWNGKVGGFGSSSMTIEWITAVQSTSGTAVDIKSGTNNNYITGDFFEQVSFSSTSLMSTSDPSIQSSYFIRFGDVFDPAQGAYYKADGQATDEDLAEISLYPNPSDGNYFLSWTRDCEILEIQIVDQRGSVVKTERLNGKSGNAHITLNNVSSGIYFMQLKFDNDPKTLRLIKQ
jgi:hypothetical protein